MDTNRCRHVFNQMTMMPQICSQGGAPTVDRVSTNCLTCGGFDGPDRLCCQLGLLGCASTDIPFGGISVHYTGRNPRLGVSPRCTYRPESPTGGIAVNDRLRVYTDRGECRVRCKRPTNALSAYPLDRVTPSSGLPE